MRYIISTELPNSPAYEKARMRLRPAYCLYILASLLGCGQGRTSGSILTDPNLPIVSQTLSGKAMDGKQPISGAHVYLLAANTTGYGNDSVPLLLSDSTGYSDTVGAYVLTGQDGSFTIPGTYSCTSGNSQVYLYVLGGNAGLGVNSAIGELAALGECPSLIAPALSSLVVNEVSTVAAAYALAGFATDATHISSSGTTLAQTGITSAFTNAANLVSVSSGAALTKIPSGNAIVPQSTINMLANILAACIRPANSSTSACTILFGNTQTGSVEPTDTATAAINIAHNPASNVSTLYGLQTSSSPFSPTVTAVPNDLSIGLVFNSVDAGGTNDIAIDGAGNVWLDDGYYGVIVLSNSGYLLSPSGGYMDGLNGPGDIAIDQSGNVWIGNYEAALPSSADPYNLVEISNSGTLLSGVNGYTGGGLDSERGIAIDADGNAWTVNTLGNSVSKFSSSGISYPNSPFMGGGMNFPINVAIDSTGNVWVANGEGNVTKLSNTGSVLSGPNGFSDGGKGSPFGIAIDSSGNVWAAYPRYYRVVKFSNAGQVLSGPSGYTGNGIGNGYTLAIDGAGNVWEGNYYGNSVNELSNTGEILSGANGYTSGVLSYPDSIAVDGAGNIWVPNGDPSQGYRVTELIGIATPVVTPLSVGVKNQMLGTRP